MADLGIERFIDLLDKLDKSSNGLLLFSMLQYMLRSPSQYCILDTKYCYAFRFKNLRALDLNAAVSCS
jgi:hypothetical protein